MTAVQTMLEDGFSLRKALSYSGCSRKMYYHKTIPRTHLSDPFILEMVKRIALNRPTFGTDAWLPCSGVSLESPSIGRG